MKNTVIKSYFSKINNREKQKLAEQRSASYSLLFENVGKRILKWRNNLREKIVSGEIGVH